MKQTLNTIKLFTAIKGKHKETTDLIYNTYKKCVIFRNKRISHNYIVVPNDRLQEVADYKHLYETTTANTKSKLFLDIDAKEQDKSVCLISHDDILDIITDFNKYLK